MFKKLKIYQYMIIIMLLSVGVSLAVPTVFIRHKFTTYNVEKVYQEIQRVAKQMATDEVIITNLEKGNEQVLNSYANAIGQASEIDFIVVVDLEGRRLSHPDASAVGQPFSNQEEVQRTLAGESYYSKQVGVLGQGSRYFTPIYNHQHKVIGLVCVGVIDKNIESLKKALTDPLLIGGLIGGIMGLAMIAVSSYQLRKVTLGLEPTELALKYIEKDLINDEVNDGIVALSVNNDIMLMNTSFKGLFPNSLVPQGKANYLDSEVKKAIFQDVLETRRKIKDEIVYFAGLELVVSVSPIFLDQRYIGAVATIKDQSEFKKLMFELSGTEKYVGALRAQTHEFMNKLHIISGLIELERYEEVENYISDIQKTHQQEIGDLNLTIKNPIMLGFLIGKINEGNEKHIHVSLTKNSYIPDLTLGSDGYAFLQVLGNLIDNAMEAITENQQEDGRILMELSYDRDLNALVATVVNNGPEIPDHLKPDIFKENVSTKGQSNGYGLSICQGIVASRGGTITMTSSPYETVFQVEFPLGGVRDDN